MGSAQLVTALSAATARQTQLREGKFSGGEFNDYLVVHDLCAPNGQEEDFASCIERLARSVGRFAKIVYLNPQDVAEIRRDGRRLSERLGLEAVDEMYLGQNRVVLNRVLADTFPQAKKFCYGDSLGINFSSDYFAPRKRFPKLHSVRQSFKRWVRTRIASHWSRSHSASHRTSHRTSDLEVAFDDYCLVLPNRFDQHVAHHIPVDPGNFRDLYHRLGQQLDDSAGWTIPLAKVARQPSDVVVLMTSNFSESGKMTLAAEIAAYEELVKEETRPALVLKPHPRDSRQKILQLRDTLATRFHQLLVLDDPSSFYLPFESVFDRFFLNRFRSTSGSTGSLRVLSTSSACLSFELLYGVDCRLGFGEQAVRTYFRPEWISHRLEHERDLQAVVSEIRGVRHRQSA